MTTEKDCLDAATGFKNCDGRECADCKYYLGEQRQDISSAGSVGCNAECADVELDDVIAWADGILGALGTEHANKVTDEEARIAGAIMTASKS